MNLLSRLPLLHSQSARLASSPPSPRRYLSSDCHFNGVKVFRCQLPRLNPYYSDIPEKLNGIDKPLSTGAHLCSWCGTWKGEKICGACKKARYCSEKHQTMHWKSGHKSEFIMV